jgi:ribosomal protein S9
MSSSVLRMAPQSARQARLLRLANQLARDKTPGAPSAEADKLLWVRSHARREADQRLSREEEALRVKMLPHKVGMNAVANHGPAGGENLFHFRDYPMFPGEYVPPDHNTLSSVKDNLRADLTAQSVKTAWQRVSRGRFFASTSAFYDSVDGLDENQLGDIVHALFPDLTHTESRSLIRRILETISAPVQTASRSLAGTVAAESLGLDQAPEHYTNFLQWMGRITSTKAFATEHSIHQFCRRAFNKRDVKTMFENYHVHSPESIRHLAADGYSHFYEVLKNYSSKIAGSDTRHQTGVRIDPREVDPKTGFSMGTGMMEDCEVICMIRPNRDGTGSVKIRGKPLAEFTRDRSWQMEVILAPLDEAGLSYKDFDIYFVDLLKGNLAPHASAKRMPLAAQFALSLAISKMMPITRIPLKKAGYLSADKRRPAGDHPGFLNGRTKQRVFRKRQAKGI